MSISEDDVIALMNAFHETVMTDKGTAAEQAAYFLYPEPRIYVPHGDDITMEANYQIHQKLTDEMHRPMQQWDITPLCGSPERVRAVGAVYWQGRVIGGGDDAIIKCVVGEDWIIQRQPSGALKIVLYINSYHHFLPDSADIALG